jgi:hypothetical protein
MRADKRSVSTDALETLGMIHAREEKRDAIHLAVIPARAACELEPGSHVIVRDGVAVPAATGRGVGIVDPFLREGPCEGERFWLVLYPRTIQSLRHVWSHPAFPDEPVTGEAAPVDMDAAKARAVAYLAQVAARHEVSLEELIAGADDHLEGGDGLCFGTDIDYGMIDMERIWRSYELVTGKRAPADKQERFFRCAC